MNNLGTIDIGGTNSRIMIFDQNRKIVFSKKIRTNIEDPEKSLKPLLDHLKEYKVKLGAFCLPGPADFKRGFIINPPTMPGWHNFDIKKYVLKNSNIKNLLFENDANVMALAVHHEFNQSAKDITQFFTISTGLGAGLIINDQIIVGAKHYGQEIAFLPSSPIEEKNIQFERRYGVETFAAGSGLELRAKALGKNWSSKEIFSLYQKNEIATKLVDEGIIALGNLISISLAYINPNLIVFGGSVALFNKWYINKAIEYAKTITTFTQIDSVEFKFTSLGDDTALYGLYQLVKINQNGK